MMGPIVNRFQSTSIMRWDRSFWRVVSNMYPLVNVYIAEWKITILELGKSMMAMVSIANCNKLPEGTSWLKRV